MQEGLFITRSIHTIEKPKAFEVCSSIEGLRPLNPEQDSKDHEVFLDRYFANGQHPDELGLYRNGFAYRLQASRGNPLRYFDGTTLIDIGFRRDGREVVAIGLMGPQAIVKTHEIAQKLKGEGVTLFVKKVTDAEAEEYLKLGFENVDYATDFKPEDLPDDVYPEVLIDLPNYDELKNPGPNNGYLRQRFGKFLRLEEDLGGHRLTYFEPLSEGQPRAGSRLQPLLLKVDQFIHEWAERKAQSIGGNADDYYDPYKPLLEHFNHLGKGFVVWGFDNTQDKVISLLIATRLSKYGYGVITNLCNTDYKSLAEAMVIEATDAAKTLYDTYRSEEEQLRFLNLGGSELPQLHKFKTKFVPTTEVRMRYLKYKGV